VLDQRGWLLVAALGFAGCSMPSYGRALWALRTWLDSWSGIGRVAVGMHRQGYDLQLTQYGDRGWRADVLHHRRKPHSMSRGDRLCPISTLLTRNLHDVFGENDPARRLAVIDEAFTEDCVFYDPSKGVYPGARRDRSRRGRDQGYSP
jgi:hypothetical protein